MILALDLEGTLIADARSLMPRPGLYAFLEWAHEAIARIVLYTAVPVDHCRIILPVMVQSQSVPPWFADIEIYNPGKRNRKDLRVLGPLEQVVIVDDYKSYIRGDQRHCWIKIIPFNGHAEEAGDRDLERVRCMLTHRIERLAHKQI